MKRQEHMEPSKRITLLDVAADAGVSRSTVSLVLRNSPLVATETRERVLASIRKLGYVYNRGAARLRTQRSHTIGLLITDIANPFFAALAAGVEARLDEAGYVALFVNTADTLSKQERLLATLQEHQPDGILLCPARGTTPAHIHALRRHLPVVLLMRHLNQTAAVEPVSNAEHRFDFVGADDAHGAALATEHLIQQGHRRIAFIGGSPDSSARRERIRGYCEAHACHHLHVDAQLLLPSDVSRTGGRDAIAALLALPHAPTAALCYNDVVALGVMAGLQTAGRKAGQDFAVVGFDDIADAALWNPPLTTVANDPFRLGRAAANLLLERIQDSQGAPRHLLLPVALRVRASCCTADDATSVS